MKRLCLNYEGLDGNEIAKKTSTPLITIGNVTIHNVKQLRVIDRICFPVRYNDTYYANVVKRQFNGYFAYFNDLTVGELVYRVSTDDSAATNQQQQHLHIMTIAVLPAYRRLGVGKFLLQYAISVFRNNKKLKSIMLHVHVSNNAALRFYEKIGPFHKECTVADYYKELNPPDAYILRLNRQDLEDEKK